ncbi:MAG TPA: HTH domain-containing protein, partial [Verrucomicrobiae bacterium]|nr:HTH domain-containing protein [Verrucomicrobiae bacterium]
MQMWRVCMGANRRELIRNLIRNSQTPVKAAELAKATGVSRQVIVQDIALLRAQKEPIMATPQGYV